MHFLCDNGLRGMTGTLGPELDRPACFFSEETDGLAMVGIASRESDAALIGARHLNLGSVHHGIEEGGGGDEDAVAGGQKIDRAFGAPPAAGPAANLVGGFTFLGRARATWSMPSSQGQARPSEALVSTDTARFRSGTTAVREI